MTKEKAEISFNRKKFSERDPPNVKILGWSLAVSDIINNDDVGAIAISCITEKNTNPKGIEEISKYQLVIKVLSQCIGLIKNFFSDIGDLPKKSKVFFFIIFPLLAFYYSIQFPFYNLYPFIHYLFNPSYCDKDFDRQLRLSLASSEGMTALFKFSFNNNKNDSNTNNNSNNNANRNTNNDTVINIGGIVCFLKNSKNSSNSAILVCTNCRKIQKIEIKLNKLNKLNVHEESGYILPENLFKELESINDEKCNWKYLLKSRYQEFLMVDTSDYQQIQSIEIYDINTSRLVNVFYRRRGEKDFIISRNNEPGIFAVSTDSRLFAYSYGDNIITIYLMESGLEIVSKKFDNIYKIKFLEFIEDKVLFIIEEDKKSDVKFHIWIISGCLNDYFLISRNDIALSNNSEDALSDEDMFILSKYDGYYHTLTKANGKIVFLEDSFKVLSVRRTVFRKNYVVSGGSEFTSHDLEPWNDNMKPINGKFFNDEKLILIKGQNSVQLWKPKFQSFESFEDFENFDNSSLVYILICDNIKHETESEFQIDGDMTTIITHACKSLAYLYNHTKSINSKEKYQKFVNGTINIIKDFISKYPDNWKLMEVQYPLMAYLIYSRSFSLIKYILFGDNSQVVSQKKDIGLLHRPQSKYGSCLCYDDLKLYDGLELKDKNLKSANDLELALKFCQG
jgi:hypothetical protein